MDDNTTLIPEKHRQVMLEIPKIKKVINLLEEVYFPRVELNLLGKKRTHFQAEFVVNPDGKQGWWEIAVSDYTLYFQSEEYKQSMEDIREFLKETGLKNNVVFVFLNFVVYNEKLREKKKYVIK